MESKGLNIIIWSKDRPMQLHALLESLEKNFKELKESSVAVVYKASNKDYLSAYDNLRNIWIDRYRSGGSKIDFMFETNFYLMSIMSFGYHSQTMLCVDDQIFYEPFSIEDEIFKIHAEKPEQYFNISLRLDPTKTYCYPVEQNQQIPSFVTNKESYVSWFWKNAQFDWGYVASLDGNVYHTHALRNLLLKIQPTQITNPNTLETVLNMIQQQNAVSYPTQNLCYKRSKTCSIPVNKVQDTFQNKFENTFPSEELLKLWNDGKKINIEDLIEQVKDKNAAHNPANYTFISKT